MDDDPRLVETGDGYNVRFQGRDLYPRQPKADTHKRVSAFVLEPSTIYIVGSPLLGYGLSQLAERLPSNSKIFCWEANPVLSQLDSIFIERVQHPRLHYSDAKTLNAATFDASKIIDKKIRKIRSLSLNAGRLLSHNVYAELEDLVGNELQRFWRNRSTLLFMGPLWTRNILANLSSKFESFGDMTGGDNLLICGAGPSLEKAIPFIKKNRDKLFLVVVDTALTRISAEGIDPDLVVALESQLHNLQDFVGTRTRACGFAVDLTATPQLLRSIPSRRSYIFASNFAETALWSRLKRSGIDFESIPALGSVGLAALYISSLLRPRSIFISGLDFAGFPGLSHVRESPTHRRALRTWSRLYPNSMEIYSLSDNTLAIATNDNKLVYSDKNLLQYHKDCIDLLALISGNGVRIYDIRGGGLELPIETWPLERELTVNTGTISPQTVDTASAVEPVSQTTIEPQAKGFIAQLKQDTDRLSREIRAYHENPGADTGSMILRALEEVDFLFFDMPDTNWPDLSPGSLARALVRLEGISQKLALLLGGFED